MAAGVPALFEPRRYSGKVAANVANLSTLQPLLQASGIEKELAGSLSIKWEGSGASKMAKSSGQLKFVFANGRYGDLNRLQSMGNGSDFVALEILEADHRADDALSAASAIGHFFVYVLIGFILAIVYRLEEEELASFWKQVDPRSLGGTIGRWFGHLADSTIVTVQLQFVVAAFNTVTTLPVLLLLGVKHIAPLMVLDTSALVALLLDEPEAEEFRAAVEEDTTRLVSAATLLETALIPGAGH